VAFSWGKCHLKAVVSGYSNCETAIVFEFENVDVDKLGEYQVRSSSGSHSLYERAINPEDAHLNPLLPRGLEPQSFEP
jgi:hypothetical protein